MRINEAQTLLKDVYIDWSHVLANPRGIRRGSQITWDSYIPHVLKQPILASDVIDLFNRGQYTFQIVMDGSLIQIYYQYDSRGNEVQAASLAFYSAVAYDQVIDKDEAIDKDETVIELLQPDSDVEMNDVSFLGEEAFNKPELVVPSNGPVSWLRIDYDPAHAKGVLHYDCHMHLSAFPYARLVVAGVPTPKQFIEFIMALCYPDAYEKHRLDDRGLYTNENYILAVNSNCVPHKDHDVFRQIAHFRIPIVSESRRR